MRAVPKSREGTVPRVFPSDYSVIRAAQHTLFQCQLWHVRRCRGLAGVIGSYERADDKRFLAYLKRQLRQREKFIAAITPFVRLPL